MQLVVEISEDTFFDLKKKQNRTEVDNAVLNGTPLTKGHWIPTYGNVKCSVCGSVKDSRDVGKATHYCDFCGATMVEPQESEDKE